MTYREKLKQADREAKASVAGLFATIVVWTVCGFGLSGLDIEIFHTPLWILGGTVGTWVFAVAVAVWLSRCVSKDFDLDDEDGMPCKAEQGKHNLGEGSGKAL